MLLPVLASLPCAAVTISRACTPPVTCSRVIPPTGLVLDAGDSPSIARITLVAGQRYVLDSIGPAWLKLSGSERDRLVLRVDSELRFGQDLILVVKASARPTSLSLDLGRDMDFLHLDSSPKKPRNQPSKSVRFSPTVRLQSASGEESVEAERYEEERDAPAAQSSFAVVSSLGTRHELSPEQPQLFVGTDIPFGSAGPVACLALAGDCLHLVLPRATKARGVEVWLRLPPAFPLKSGDTADLWGDDGRLCTVQFDIPKPARSVPKSKKDGFNPAQAMPAIALETSWQDQRRSRWNGAVECAPTSAPRVASFAAGCEDIRLGRACQVGEPDQTLSSHHATVSSHPGGFFSLRPSNAKPVYLLAGKRDQQSRPAIPLRLGDTFVAGKSEFCVVFQQRGNRVALAPDRTVRDELHLRVASKSCVLHHQSPSPQQEEEFSSTSTVDVEERSPRFPNLRLDNSAAGDCVVPSFHSVDQFLEFFNLSTLSKEPMMVVMSTKGPKRKEFFVCNALETTFGSSPAWNTVSIPSDGRMSATHCRIYFCERQERWLLEDLESRNGTFLRVKRGLPLSLCPGDVLAMGLTTVRVTSAQL
ncbi:hypothetical protein BASA81_001598 [Batrachochytrium salamandrivorans]|nr:hypothetical protein BASA81_001598 [Batrachochytrium salamandrivorans]